MPKGIFIGLGGTGVTTVARLKALLYKRSYSSDKEAMDANCTFIFYDTDNRAMDKAMNDPELKMMMDDHPVIDSNEFIDAGSTVPYNMYMHALDSSTSNLAFQRMLEWAIDPQVPSHLQMPRQDLRGGAGTQRMTARTGVLYTKNEFEKRILEGLRKIQHLIGRGTNLKMEHPAIWVFASSCGATGSSAILDVLYMVDRMYKTHVENSEPYLRLVLYMPKSYIDLNRDNAPNYACNAYSTLWELNEFRFDAVIRNDGKKFGTFAIQPDKIDWTIISPWNVCSYVLAVDNESQNGIIPLEQMYNNTAELCYFLHTGAVGYMVGELDNLFLPYGPYAHSLRTPTDDNFQWTKFVVGAGYKAITKADDFLKDYVRTRLGYDLFGYGLLGFEMEQILPNSEDRNDAVKQFSDEYILCHLINIYNFEKSRKDSLYMRYRLEFDHIVLPAEDAVPSKDEWSFMGTSFITECKKLMQDLQRRFNDPSSTGSKAWSLGEIEKTVMAGVEKAILEFGLRYTLSLLSKVDDAYCEFLLMSVLQTKQRLNDIEEEIQAIIVKNIPPQGVGKLFSREKTQESLYELVMKMQEYKEECVRELAIEHIRSIIVEITKENSGLLEYLRKGNKTHVGIAGLIEAIQSKFQLYKRDYQNLASTFRKTATDCCNDYVPQVDQFVDAGDAWVRLHEFEELYSSLLPLDTSNDALPLESLSFGCPPIRREVDNGVAPMLNEIKTRVPNQTYLFAEMAMSHPQTSFNILFTSFSKQVDAYIETLFTDHHKSVGQWLSLNLENIFDNQFMTDGMLDSSRRELYITHFKATVPVFYPTDTGVQPEVTQRWVFVGASQAFATTLGFQNGNSAHQYIPDTHIGNRFLVCKLEVGHNFYDYKYFDVIRRYYESNLEAIENQGCGCHIHKGFIHRDIIGAIEETKTQKFKDFIALCWYDCFFEYLYGLSDKKYIEAFFGESISEQPFNPLPLELPMLGIPSGNQMPMGLFGMGPNMNNRNGYRPIIKITLLEQIQIHFKSLYVSNKHLTFEKEDERVMTLSAKSLSDVWREIINFENVLYADDYFSPMKQVFQNLPKELKKEIQDLFYVASTRNDVSGKIGYLFFQKTGLVSQLFRNTQSDYKIWQQAMESIQELLQKNIFLVHS